MKTNEQKIQQQIQEKEKLIQHLQQKAETSKPITIKTEKIKKENEQKKHPYADKIQKHEA